MTKTYNYRIEFAPIPGAGPRVRSAAHANHHKQYQRITRQKMLVRTIKPDELNTIKKEVAVFDVRREEDYEKSEVTIPGAVWKTPL